MHLNVRSVQHKAAATVFALLVITPAAMIRCHARDAWTTPAATPDAAQKLVLTAVANAPEARAVQLPRMAARPNWIIGRTVFENGQPVPKFHVQAGGFSGKFDPFLNNQLKGPQQLSETGSAFGVAEGVNGRYAIHMTEDATMTGVSSLVQLRYDDANWAIMAWPTDNIGIGTDPSRSAPYHAHTKNGIVRDFILKLSGLKPGYDPAKCPDHGTNTQPNTPYAYYGGTIVFDCGSDSTPAAYGGGVAGMMASRGGVTKVYPKGSIITVTLTPTGPRVDGLPARAVIRSCPVDVNFSLFGIPYAHYSATATLKEPSGAVHNIQLADKPPLTVDTWHASVPVRWQPWENHEPIALTMWVAE